MNVRDVYLQAENNQLRKKLEHQAMLLAFAEAAILAEYNLRVYGTEYRVTAGDEQ